MFNSKCKHCSAVDNGALNFIPALAICFQIANQKQGGVLNFKRLSQDGRRQIFSDNLRASIFNDDLSYESTFFSQPDPSCCTVPFNVVHNILLYSDMHLLDPILYKKCFGGQRVLNDL